MKSKIRIISFIVVFILLFSACLPVSAVEELDGDNSSYVFDFWGNTVSTPVPYETEAYINLSSYGDVAPTPTDMASDADGNIYVADSSNNCIWQLDPALNVVKSYNEYIINETPTAFAACEGCWVADGKLYVANTLASNIVVLDVATGETLQIVEKPSDEEWSSTIDFEPIKLTTDRGGRIYVISRNQTQGIVQFSAEGGFIGYLGALDVDPTLWDIFIRNFGTEKMKESSLQLIPTEFTNIICNEEGMVYAITETVTDAEIKSAVTSKDAENAPVRLFNPLGNNILNNNGYYPIVGDIDFKITGYDAGASRFNDVAVGPNGVFSLLDRKRGKIFTYDYDGNLLYVFGGLGAGLGKFEQPVSMIYIGDKLAILDQLSKKVTLFETTDFSHQVLDSYAAHEAGDYEKVEQCWRSLEKKYSGYDLASLGIGKALYNRGEYKAAMERFKMANNKEYYSKAYKNLQAGIAENNILLVFIIAIVAVVGIFFALRIAIRAIKKSNNFVCRTLVDGCYVMTHPFDGMWELKWEGKGTVGGATILLVAAFVIRIVAERCVPYLFSSSNLSQTNTLISTLSLVITLMLWVVSSWCLTTLFDGKGKIKDIYIYLCYSLTPYVLFTIPVLLLGQFLTLEMSALYTSLQMIIIFYCLLLILTGTISIHQFSLSRTVLMLIVSIAGVALMMFLIILCAGLMQNIVDFVTQALKEIMLRYS